jgi:WD40 repeat protein
LETGQPGQVFRPEAGFVLDVAFSPDGRYALASTASGAAFMWPVEGGDVIQRFALDGPAGAPSVAVSPDGTRVAVGSRFGQVVLFEAGSGRQQGVFSGHTDVVRDLAFSPDGTQLLSASADGTARLWDVVTGTELRRYNRRPFTVHSAVFAPDGRTVLVAANDGLARRYDVDYQGTVQYLCRRLQRDLSEEEQAQYEINGEVTTCQP